MFKTGITLLLFFAMLTAFSQQSKFHQSTLLFDNPAFYGTGINQRVALAVYDRWSQLPGAFQTYQIVADHNFSRYHGGIGMSYVQSTAGKAAFSTNHFLSNYSYRISIADSSVISFGINAGLLQSSYNPSTFEFIAPPTNELDYNRTSQATFGSGIGVISKYFSGGYSFLKTDRLTHNIIGQSLIKTNKNIFNQNHLILFVPHFRLKADNNSTQLGLGINTIIDILSFGLQYENVNTDGSNFSSITYNIGFVEHNIGIYYSYETNRVLSNSNFVSLTYEFIQPKRRKMRRPSFVEEPTFH